eukprot:374933-Karenia_brevis.AAC.1
MKHEAVEDAQNSVKADPEFAEEVAQLKAIMEDRLAAMIKLVPTTDTQVSKGAEACEEAWKGHLDTVGDAAKANMPASAL